MVQEIRISKSETRNKFEIQIPNDQNIVVAIGFLFGAMGFWSFAIVSNFVLRISDFRSPANSSEVETQNSSIYKLVEKKEVCMASTAFCRSLFRTRK